MEKGDKGRSDPKTNPSLFAQGLLDCDPAWCVSGKRPGVEMLRVGITVRMLLIHGEEQESPTHRAG